MDTPKQQRYLRLNQSSALMDSQVTLNSGNCVLIDKSWNRLYYTVNTGTYHTCHDPSCVKWLTGRGQVNENLGCVGERNGGSYWAIEV